MYTKTLLTDRMETHILLYLTESPQLENDFKIFKLVCETLFTTIPSW